MVKVKKPEVIVGESGYARWDYGTMGQIYKKCLDRKHDVRMLDVSGYGDGGEVKLYCLTCDRLWKLTLKVKPVVRHIRSADLIESPVMIGRVEQIKACNPDSFLPGAYVA